MGKINNFENSRFLRGLITMKDCTKPQNQDVGKKIRRERLK